MKKKIDLLNKKKEIVREIKEKEEYLSRLKKTHSKLIERLINKEIKKEFGSRYSFTEDSLKKDDTNLIDIYVTSNNIDVNPKSFIFENSEKLESLIISGEIAKKIKEKNFLFEAVELLNNQKEKYNEKIKKFNIPKLKHKENELKEKIRNLDKEIYIKENIDYGFDICIYDNSISSYYSIKALRIIKSTKKMAECKFMFSNGSYVIKRKSKDNILNIIKRGKMSKLDKRKIILNNL